MLRMRIASVHVPGVAVAQLEAFGDVAELAKEAHRLRAQRAERVVFALDQFRPATYEDGLLTAERTTVSMADEQHRQHAYTKRSGFPVGMPSRRLRAMATLRDSPCLAASHASLRSPEHESVLAATTRGNSEARCDEHATFRNLGFS
jgi:hypothetical protein